VYLLNKYVHTTSCYLVLCDTEAASITDELTTHLSTRLEESTQNNRTIVCATQSEGKKESENQKSRRMNVRLETMRKTDEKPWHASAGDRNHKLTINNVYTATMLSYNLTFRNCHCNSGQPQGCHMISRTQRPPALVYAGRRLAASVGPLVSIGVRLLARPFARATIRDCMSFSPVTVFACSNCPTLRVLFLLL
jgi:hypothetical protein